LKISFVEVSPGRKEFKLVFLVVVLEALEVH